MSMLRKTLIATFAAALGLGAGQAAYADSKGFVVSLFVPAMNNKDTDCPGGNNPIAPEILKRVLTEQGMPQAEIDKVLAPGTFNGGVYSQYATMRGRIDGKPVNVYRNPMSAPDPKIKLAEITEAFGFNLDGKDGEGQFTDPQTGEKGVDNATARVFGCFDRTRGTLETPPTNWSVRWNYYGEGNSWLINVSKPDGALTLKNDDNVTVTFYRGLQPPTKNASGYQRLVTYDIDADPRLQQNIFKGRIRDGLFVSDAPVDFRMIGNPQIQPVYDFKSSRLRIGFKPDGDLEGFIGGYLPINNIYVPFGDYGAGAEFNGGMDIVGVYHAMRRLADTDIDADPATGTRTRISQTYLIRGVPAFLARPPSRSAALAR